MFRQIADLVLTRPLPVALVATVVVVTGVLGVFWLQFDFRVTTFFSSSDPQVVVLDEHRRFWGADDNVLVVTVSATSGDLLDRDHLARVARTTAALGALPGVSRASSIADAPSLGRLRPGVIDPRTVAQTQPRDDGRVGAWRAEVLAGPWVPMLLSRDARTGAILVEFDKGAQDLIAVRDLVRGAEAVTAEAHDSDLRYGLGGIPAIRGAFVSSLVADQALFVPVSVAFVGLLLLLLFRRIHGLIPLVGAFLPTAVVIGLLGWAGEPIGLINQVFFTMLPIIAVADGIHMVSRTHEVAGRQPGPLTRNRWRVAIRAAVVSIGTAVALTSFTTGVGFLSLTSARMGMLRSFGLFGAIGMALAFATTVFVVPLLLSWAPPSIRRSTAAGPLDRFLAACAAIAIRRKWWVVAGTVVLVAASAGFATRVDVDNRVSEVLGLDNPVTVANDLADRELGGVLRFGIDIHGDFDDPTLLADVLAVERWVQGLDGVATVSGPATRLSWVYRLLAGRDGVPATAPHLRELYRATHDTPVLTGLVSPDHHRGRILVRVQDRGGRRISELAARVRAGVAERLPGVKADVIGTTLVAYEGILNVVGDLRTSLALAFGIILITIFALFRSVRVALACLVPNGLPLLGGYAFLGAMGWMLEPGLAVVLTVALGIAVDDTVHLLHRTREEMKGGAHLDEALGLAVLHSGRAVTITSFVLVAGLLINTASSFPSIQRLAVLGAVVIALAWLCDLLVLPALLAIARPWVRRSWWVPRDPAESVDDHPGG